MNNTSFVVSVSILENGFRAGNKTVSLPRSELLVAFLNLLCRVGILSGWRVESSNRLRAYIRFSPNFRRPLFILRSTGSRPLFLDCKTVSTHPSPYLILSTPAGLKTSYEAAVAGLGGLLLLELNLF